MEFVVAILIVCLSALALGAGLMLGRGAPTRSCDGLACVGGRRCDGCPHREGEEAKK